MLTPNDAEQIHTANAAENKHFPPLFVNVNARVPSAIVNFSGTFCWVAQALMVDAMADKRLYEQELARMRKENAFLEDQARERHMRAAFCPACPILPPVLVFYYACFHVSYSFGRNILRTRALVSCTQSNCGFKEQRRLVRCFVRVCIMLPNFEWQGCVVHTRSLSLYRARVRPHMRTTCCLDTGTPPPWVYAPRTPAAALRTTRPS